MRGAFLNFLGSSQKTEKNHAKEILQNLAIALIDTGPSRGILANHEAKQP